jgi:hypothetical protein
MTSKLVEIEPGRFRFVKPATPPARSSLPLPYVISDTMPETEQVDGRFYTSKSQFRAVGRSLGLIEVGNEKFKPKVRATDYVETKQARRTAIKKAVEKYKSGHRVRRET